MKVRFHSENASVELTVHSYQFPESQSVYDSNWLIIHGYVEHPDGNWDFYDPCLLTYEAQSLANWLEDVAQDCEKYSSISFLEPNLSFSVLHGPHSLVLSITFNLESRPQRMKPDETLTIDISIEPTALRREACRWRDQLSNFPQRAER